MQGKLVGANFVYLGHRWTLDVIRFSQLVRKFFSGFSGQRSIGALGQADHSLTACKLIFCGSPGEVGTSDPQGQLAGTSMRPYAWCHNRHDSRCGFGNGAFGSRLPIA